MQLVGRQRGFGKPSLQFVSVTQLLWQCLLYCMEEPRELACLTVAAQSCPTFEITHATMHHSVQEYHNYCECCLCLLKDRRLPVSSLGLVSEELYVRGSCTAILPGLTLTCWCEDFALFHGAKAVAGATGNLGVQTR